jgi:hypothetical protein
MKVPYLFEKAKVEGKIYRWLFQSGWKENRIVIKS